MKLPKANTAIADQAKVRDYLLSPEHSVGRLKARVFRAAGYERETWQRLRNDLLALARTVDVIPTLADEFGRRFIDIGALAAPNGHPLPVTIRRRLCISPEPTSDPLRIVTCLLYARRRVAVPPNVR
jgi:hypothetical protein